MYSRYYVAPEVFLKKMKPFSTGRIIKESLEATTDVAISDKGYIISKITLSSF
jgi:hypothetical protein